MTSHVWHLLQRQKTFDNPCRLEVLCLYYPSNGVFFAACCCPACRFLHTLNVLTPSAMLEHAFVLTLHLTRSRALKPP